jgi:SAM-dependent methyltransferase
MRSLDIARMHAVEQDHWWFVGKRRLFVALLRERLARGGLRILDVGCGTGATSIELARHGRVWSLDASREALAFARSRGVRRAVVADAADPPFAPESFDLIVAFDVIEHVEDDLGMVRRLRGLLAPGGALAVHVPAWPFLMGAHDVVLGHYRRYTRKSLRAALLENGLAIERLGWASASILPLALALRTLERLAPFRRDAADLYPLPGRLNAVMKAVYRVETLLAEQLGLPFGLSLAAVARRDA